jgi:predicted  nucleic acid-binding Zn-ribbon protein
MDPALFAAIGNSGKPIVRQHMKFLWTHPTQKKAVDDVEAEVAKKLADEFSPVPILERSETAATNALSSLHGRADRLEREIKTRSEELRQTRVAIEAYSKASEIMTAGRLPVAAE